MSPPQRPQVAWNAAALLTHVFPEPRWAVPGLVAEGLTLFVGAPKVGKSWAAWNLAVAVSTGGTAFGKVPVEAGDVLYLALEDTPRRLQGRLRKVLQDQPAPTALTIVTSCPTLAQGAAEMLGDWLTKHPDARLVIVDVFARVRGRASPSASAYEADYGPMSELKAVADAHSVAMLVVHHTRKAASEDFLDEVSGTHGLAGAADAIVVLKRSRGTADAVLHVTGRDVEEAEYALRFVADTGAWEMLDGSAQDHAVADTRQRILRHVREVGAATPKQVADALGINYETAKKTCRRMADDDQLDTNGQGHYFPAPLSPVPAVPAVPHDREQGHLHTLSVPEESASDVRRGHEGQQGHLYGDAA